MRSLGSARTIVLGALALWLACEDPVREQQQADLGPEIAGVRPSALHRPGQPCLVCHQAGGTALPTLAIAGTIYTDPETRVAVNQATIVLQDRAGHTQKVTSNCAGNFMLRPEELRVEFPMWTTVQAGGQSLDMESPIYREGSCAGCHGDPRDQTSAGHIFILPDSTFPPLPESYRCR
jgi:hypothetical protein